MARLIGYIANRPDRLRDAFHQERAAITGLPAEQRGAWGLGFYQGDEVLHKKQPLPDGQPVNWDVVAQNVRTDCAIAHVRQATVGGFSVDNTHPFRFRQWLFAHVGTIASFDEVGDALRAGLPDFLRRNIRGSSDSEVLFHLILAGLHQTNQLDAATPTNQTIVGAISAAVQKVAKETRGQESSLNLILCNGRVMVGLRQGGPFGIVERTGVTDPAGSNASEDRPGSPLLRYVMMVGGGQDVPAGYEALAPNHVAVVSRSLDVHTHRL